MKEGSLPAYFFNLHICTLSYTNKRRERIPQVLVIHHIHFDAADRNGAFYSHRNAVTIVAYPHGHFFSTFEDGAFDKQWFEFDGFELSIFGLDILFAEVTYVEVVSFIVKEYGKWDLVIHLVFAEVNIS